MESTFRIQTRVLPGNRVEVSAPGHREGAPVEVILLFPDESAPQPSALEIIESLNGHRLFKSHVEADEYLQAERDSWDR